MSSDGLQAEHSEQAAVDLGHERGREPGDWRVKVDFVDGDESRDVQHGVLGEVAGEPCSAACRRRQRCDWALGRRPVSSASSTVIAISTDWIPCHGEVSLASEATGEIWARPSPAGCVPAIGWLAARGAAGSGALPGAG